VGFFHVGNAAGPTLNNVSGLADDATTLYAVAGTNVYGVGVAIGTHVTFRLQSIKKTAEFIGCSRFRIHEPARPDPAVDGAGASLSGGFGPVRSGMPAQSNVIGSIGNAWTARSTPSSHLELRTQNL
jgi:hypothetical protein